MAFTKEVVWLTSAKPSQSLSLLTKSVRASHRYARLIRFLTQIDTRPKHVENTLHCFID